MPRKHSKELKPTELTMNTETVLSTFETNEETV